MVEIEASIIIPTKNGATHLEKVLQMIYAQVYHQPFEVIVIDSGSTDGTLGIVFHMQPARRASKRLCMILSRFGCKLVLRYVIMFIIGENVGTCYKIEDRAKDSSSDLSIREESD